MFSSVHIGSCWAINSRSVYTKVLEPGIFYMLLLPDICSCLSKTCGIIFVRIDVFFSCFALPNEVVIFISNVVLAVPSSIGKLGNFMLEARKTSGLVPLARTFQDARQWYPTAGGMWLQRTTYVKSLHDIAYRSLIFSFRAMHTTASHPADTPEKMEGNRNR